MAKIYDHDEEAFALCPLRDDVCLSQCMLMRPTAFGEPRCSIRVIADELVLIGGYQQRQAQNNEKRQ